MIDTQVTRFKYCRFTFARVTPISFSGLDVVNESGQAFVGENLKTSSTSLWQYLKEIHCQANALMILYRARPLYCLRNYKNYLVESKWNVS